MSGVVGIISAAALPAFVLAVLGFALARGTDCFEAFVAGAKGGAAVAFRVLPYMVGMIFAVDIFSAGGGFELLERLLGPAAGAAGIPPELLPLAVMRPFSGGASAGMLAAVLGRFGADSYVGRVAATFMGSSETLFYTVGVYFGSVGITKTRFVIPAALITDAAGLFISCALCRWIYG